MSEKKVGKRLLTWVLVLVMTLSLLPLNVLADSDLLDELPDEQPTEEDMFEMDEDASDVAELTALPVWNYDYYTGAAEFYYLKSPTSDPDSNGNGDWGKLPLGVGKINIAKSRFEYDAGKNAKNIKSNEIISWPNSNPGGLSFTLDKNNRGQFQNNWSEIFENYKSLITAQYGDIVTENDITSITFKPYKISRKNLSSYMYHVDCTVDIKCENFVTVKFYFVDATGEHQLFSNIYRKGNSIPTDDIAAAESAANDFVPNDHELIKWYSDPEFTRSANPNAELTGNVTFYCKAEPVKTYTVTYDLNGGTGTVPKDDGEYRLNEEVTVKGGDDLKKDGYEFTGWNTKEDGTGIAYAISDTFEITKDTTLYAQWKAKEYSYTVKYYKDSELLDTVTSDVTYEQGAQILKDVIEDKCPAGYALDTGKSTQMPYTITDGDNIIEVYYTKRTDLSYTVNYYWNGTTDKAAESKTVENQTFGEEVTVSPAEIEGYTPVFPKDQTITIGADNSENVINFNYYKNVTLTAKSDTKIYDGKEHTVEGYTGAPEGVTFDITASGTGIDAGTYDVTFSDGTVGKTDTTAKYIVTKTVDGTLTINPVTDEVIVTIKGNTDSKTYNGEEQSVTGYKVTNISNPLYVASNIKFNGNATAKGTDAVTYKMNLTAADFENTSKNFSNVTFKVTDGSLTINKCLVTITAKNVTTVYNGESPVVKDYTILREVSNGDPVNTLPTDHKIDSYVTYGSGVDAGLYERFSMDGAKIVDKNGEDVTSNYQISYEVGTLTITKRPVTLTSKGGQKVYDGTPLTKPDVTVTGDGFVTGEATNIKATGTITDVGTVTNTITFAKGEKFKDSNYAITKTEGTLEVTKREVTLTSASDSKVYDGTALTNGTVNVGGKGFAKDEGATYDVTGTITNVGTADNKFTYTLNDGTDAKNYTITKNEGTLEVTPVTAAVTVTIKGNTKTVYYNGKEQSVKGYTVSIDNNLYKEADFALKNDAKAEAKGTKVDTYPMGLTKESFENTNKNFTNVVFVVKDGYLEITRSGGHHPRPKPTVEIEDDDALGLNTTDHFAYIVGYGNGEVRPQNNITRAEVATIFFRLLTDDVRDENLTKTNRYSDVTRADWYNTAVSTLSSMGIITGYPDGTFRPNAAITRAEFAAIAARFDNDGDKTAAKFSDIATHWAKDEISIAYNNGWITGYPDGTFGPQRDITRAETMTLVNRVLNRQPETEDDLLPNMTVWTDNANPNAWYYLAVQEATNSHYYKFKTNSKYEKWTELRETRDWTQLEK